MFYWHNLGGIRSDLLNTIVVNLFGEPGAGKSTAAMDITARLKRKGINAEYVSEFAKRRRSIRC